MVTPETLNALEVVKLILFLCSLTPPLSDLSFSLFLSCDRHTVSVPCSCILQADAGEYSVFIAFEEITQFLYTVMLVMEIRLILAHFWLCILSVFISFPFSYNPFQVFVI